MGHLYDDVKVSMRLLMKSKGFALVAILLLACGIGLNMSVFAIANCALFRPMQGVKDPKTLALIGRTQNGSGFDNTSWATYSQLRRGSRLFADLAAFSVRPFSLAVDGRTERLMGGEVSENYFDTVGVKPAFGRLFRRDEGQKAKEDTVAVLSYSYWQAQFGGDRSLVGKSVLVNGHPFTIVGIAEPGFRGHEIRQGDIWVLFPTTALFSGSDEFLQRYDYSMLTMVGRLKSGIDVKATQQEVRAIFDGLQRRFPRELEHQGMRVTAYHPLGQADAREIAIQVFSVFGALCALVLLSVCANLGGVILARALARQREFAIRLSLGAGRWQIIRQMLVEASLLTLSGAALGMTIAVWIGDLFMTSLPFDGFTVSLNLSPDWRALLILVGLCVFSILSFVALPVWQTTRLNLQIVLKGGEGSVVSQKSWAREGLVFVQVFVCVVLLSGAALLGKTLWNLNQVDLRMKPDHLLSVAIHPGLNGYNAPAAKDLFRRLQERLTTMPGVVSATSTAMLPLSGGGIGIGGLHGGSIDKKMPLQSDVSIVGPRYLETMGIPILRGRDIRDSDSANSQQVTVLNETIARKFFGDEEPVGRSIFLIDEGKSRPLLVVGLARDSAYRMLGEEKRSMFFVPAQQQDSSRQTFLVRTKSEPMALLEPVKKVIAELDPNLPIYDIKTMQAQLDSASWPWRAMSIVAVIAGSLAALIAVVGLFGLISWTVTRRIREIGLKMALGADNKVILRETVWRGARSAILAAVSGFAVSLLLAGQLKEFLFGLDPRDPLLFLSLAAGFALVIAAAIFGPARRALRISPLEALRYE